jgi:hypothetical protein
MTKQVNIRVPEHSHEALLRIATLLRKDPTASERLMQYALREELQAACHGALPFIETAIAAYPQGNRALELTRRNEAVVMMRRNGAKLRDIGKSFGISTPRVAQILRKHGMTVAQARAVKAVEPRQPSPAAQRAAEVRAKWAAIAAQNVAH